MPYDFFESGGPTDEYSEDVKADRLKARELKMREGRDVFTSSRRSRLGSRHDLPQDKWGSNEVAYEFMARLSNYFHIKNNITIRVITGAFATMRKAQGTNPLEEIKMMDLFFDSTKFEKYDDGEHLWKLFIHRAAELAVQAKRMMVSVEQQEQSAMQAVKSQEWLNE